MCRELFFKGRKNLIGFALIALVFLGCTSSDPVLDIQGHYTGIFERDGNTSNVELILENQEFSGAGDMVKYPAICKGGYILSENSVTFENHCPWTAEFDWTLILSGTWKYHLSGNILTLTKSNGDIYVLEKQDMD